MQHKRNFLIIGITLSVLVLASLTGAIRLFQPILFELTEVCQTQAATSGEITSSCEHGPAVIISILQTLIVFVGAYALLVRAMRILKIEHVAIISILVLVATLLSEFALPPPQEYITLPAEEASDWLLYYLFVGKEVIFVFLLAKIYANFALTGNEATEDEEFKNNEKLVLSSSKGESSAKIVKKSTKKTASKKKPAKKTAQKKK